MDVAEHIGAIYEWRRHVIFPLSAFDNCGFHFPAGLLRRRASDNLLFHVQKLDLLDAFSHQPTEELLQLARIRFP